MFFLLLPAPLRPRCRERNFQPLPIVFKASEQDSAGKQLSIRFRRTMLTITVTKEINGKNVKVSTKPFDEDTFKLSELNSELQEAIGKLLDKE